MHTGIDIMRKSIFTIAFTAIVLSISGYTNAEAKSVEFIDNTLHFDSYDLLNPVYPEDEYGTPKVYSITVNWDDTSGLLEKIVINLSAKGRQLFDSLFINSDYGDTDTNIEGWDYLVHSGGNNHYLNNYGAIPLDGLWSVNEDYTYTTNKSGGRLGHANGIDAGSLTDRNSTITGVYNEALFDSNNPDAYLWTITYDFSSIGQAGIQLGDNFAIAYTPWCANDVVLVTHSAEPVPEPATMLLFGAGICGLASVSALRRRKK
jgi:hypothetical protein